MSLWSKGIDRSKSGDKRLENKSPFERYMNKIEWVDLGHDVLYARFGPLFAYIYENDKISIMTKFKGEKKREIAKEIIAKEIVVGKTGGKKK